ncbi:hypothetical protein ACQP2P_24460 [Dactylosporangium sp. CA-139114]|uniref:hypothetical protein n=1 Tax=Dactylosporangium sp. CA-139114 TaxID=3239931 RepID=UPI003D996F58
MATRVLAIFPEMDTTARRPCWSSGREQVRRLHESVYERALAGVARPSSFVPHMTIGRSAGFGKAAELALPLAGRAQALTVYRRDEDGRRVRELELPLGPSLPRSG